MIISMAALSHPMSDVLVSSIGKVFIIAYKESTQPLEEAFAREGLECEVLRQTHRPEFQEFSPSYLCLLNHCRAWQYASRASQPTLIVEADFVPVLGFGQLPLPCSVQEANLGIAWLYVCAPQIYSISQDGYAEGFSTSMVAYLVSPQSARCLIDLVKEIQQKYGATHYSAWDSGVDQFLRDRHFKNYIPFRNYGEHGGRPNPEHRQHGLSPAHRADVLYGRLAFMPMYATENSKNPSLNYFWARLHARLKGMARLITGKFLRLKVLHHSTVPVRLLSFSIRRQLTTRL